MQKISHLLAASLLCTALPCARAQSTSPTAPNSSANPNQTTTPRKHHKQPHQTMGANQAIPRETAPVTAPTSPNAAAETPAQRAQDQRLLQQQQAQSANAAAVNNKVVQQASQQQQQQQNEIRIQDAPGPAQTGVVPAAGPPVVPVTSDTRIQDAPGPAQTIPAPATTTQQTSPPPQV